MAVRRNPCIFAATNPIASAVVYMNRFLLSLKRPFIWLCRFRHRRGYGVHSPFAFSFIKGVVFERTAYYGYAPLREQEKEMARREGRGVLAEGLRVRRLLFRVVNYAHPATIIDVGVPAASSLYLKAACGGAVYTGASGLSDLFLEAGVPIDFLYVHDFRHPELVEEVFRVCAPRATSHSVFVVEGIRYTPAMSALWKRLCKDGRVGVTFDLYDLGILFFDMSKPKQHYIVNF